MVSGLVTSPWDQDRIFSGLARRIRIASKSSIDRPGSRLGLIGIITLIGTTSNPAGAAVKPAPLAPRARPCPRSISASS